MDYTYERTLPIPIQNYSIQHNCKELSLNHNLVDPSKMSPPNIFMDKLIKRLDNYYSPSKKTTDNSINKTTTKMFYTCS
jgi:hypothetical protein